MWPLARRNRRSVSPTLYSGYDTLDPYRGYSGYDSIAPAYGYNYRLGGYGLGSGEYITVPNGVEFATRSHASAQLEMEKAKEKYDEAKKKFEDCEKKVKHAEEMLRMAKLNARYGN
jgi:hypothetical protein